MPHSPEKHPLHLKTPDLQSSKEVERAVERQERQSGEKLPNEPTERIEAYIDRLENIFLNPDEKVRERNLNLMRDQIYDALIIKPDNFPDSFFELQKRVARERGQAIEEIPENIKEQMIETSIADQKASLDAWMDYLTSDDAVYPAWFKYYAWNNIIKLSQFDKARGEFKKRTKSTVAPFPDIYREPLAQIADLYEKVKEDNKALSDPEIQTEFSKKFPTLYAELIQKSLASQIENQEEIKGKWIKYEQGDMNQARKLFQSLENKGTGWCTAGRATAETQIESGDFYVFYTNDKDGIPSQPRLAIRMDGQDKIGEVRGVLPHQNVEPALSETLEEKLSQFGSEADSYRKKSEDMKTLTEIDRKTQSNEQLTKSELTFLYEVDYNIEGFGYQRDPRIKELRDQRDKNTDMLVIFECQSSQIIHNQKELEKALNDQIEIKAYVGELFPNIFKLLPEDLEQIYTEFPEGKIKQKTIELGTGLKTKDDFIKALEQKKVQINNWPKDMMGNKQEFTTAEEKTAENLVILTVASLGFKSGATVQDIYDQAQELGLEICPPETGPQLRLQYPDQLNGEYILIAMKPIADSVGYPYLFCVHRNDGEPWLLADGGRPDGRYDGGNHFAFVPASRT